MITGGSIAVKDKNTFVSWIDKFGANKIILGADVKENKIAVSGWKEDSGIDIIGFIKDYVEKGITKVISTDISKDGMLVGPSFELYETLRKNFSELHIIASGGVSRIEDITKLHEKNIPSVIIGKAIYEGKITLKQIQNLYK